ncbi:ribosomal RNA-processing protein 12 [Cordyceps fumosorosea ARSEF 2679]|uniref:Ribosomal RNA-processing protein 12 n=1 Tax=Cordyceps fumosorosea (strain ARSEF 2679) TaxID=1081104 RepID=A0A162MVN8_CORFA|nr:ribosomal RNA-processing protein 12 [Cordyceps fumosorosea ARSEF 2679]OAA71269.1 ribosomal RNA-processing protein 12 [Cordyceps fumosorosea ARSEF 2679]
MAVMSTLSLAEKLDKIKSPGLQSQQRTVVVLQAVESTLKEQNTEPTPTGYFAALLALLQNANSSGTVNTELATPVVYLLDVVTPHAPEALLRSKFTQILTLLAPVRRRAQDALKRVLRNPPPSPAIDHPAADMCAQTALKNLEDLATQALAARKGKKAAAAAAHDPELIHALQLVKTVAAASGGWPSTKIESLCELLLNIAKTGNEYMTMAAFEIFELIFEGMSEEVSSAKLPRLMEIISELRPAANDTQLVPPWLAILSRGYDVSAQMEPEETFQKLPDLFRMVAQFLESQSENIRISASECLISFMANCIPQQVIIDPSIYDEKTLEKVAKTAESLLTVQFQAAWLQTFNVLAAMFLSLRWRANPILLSVTKTIGEIRENSSFRNKKEADEVIGQAVRAMGPEAVLSVLPLNLIKPVKGQAGRAWMLPILRDYTSNTDLAHFRREMVPLSEVMFQRVLEHGEAPKTMEIKIYETLVQQVWSILPGYCDLPLDLTEAFDQTFAEMIANLLYKQTELRLDVCRALKTVVESNQALSTITEEEDDFLLQARVSKETAASNLAYLGQYAGNMLAVLFNVYTQTLPQSRGPILQTVNAFLSITPKQELMDTFDRVSKMLASELENLPVAAGDKEKGNKGGKDHMPSTAQTLMDLVITMSAYLPRESFATLFEIATLIIGRDDEPQLQKKAYKLIPRLATSELGQAALQERSSELQQLIVSSSAKVSAPARRDRLAAISALLPYVPDTALHFIPSVLSEVVICCKENNERAREAAYELLVQMGTRMAAAGDAPIDNRLVPHMPDDAPAGVANIEEFFTMVSAGLAGSTPHMISASVTAISRLLYEFRAALGEQTLSDLVQTMDLFLTSNNREIVKSCLGFVKVCVVSLPTELMRPRLATLVPNLIVWSSEHKGHFKAKVKHILERMVRRFGYDDLHKNCPEEARKLIVNIRKSKDRAKRKKDAARAGGGDDSGDEEDDEEAGGKQQFDTEYDRAIYSSESEGDDDNDDDEEAPRQKKKTQKGGKTYILEDDDEPLDLLDKKALANISSTKPSRTRQPQRGKSRAKVDLDGKLILGKDDDAAAAAADDNAMEIDQPEGGSGVGAYVAAIKGKDAARRGRGGKLKFSNRRSRDDAADDDDDGEQLDEKAAVIIKNRISPGKAGGDRGRGGFRGGRGRGGGGGGGGARSGRGGIANGRRGLGVEKKRGGAGPTGANGVGKGRRGGGRN